MKILEKEEQCSEYIGKDVLNQMKIAKNYNNSLVNLCIKKLLPDNRPLIDLGAGAGTISMLMKNKGYNIECVECDRFLAENLVKYGFKTVYDINEYENNSLSHVMSFNVLEHVENDEQFLKDVYSKLQHGGKFLLFVPAFSSLYSSFDRVLGHFRRYDKKDLINLVKKCGFKILETEYFDSIGCICAYLYKIVNKTGKLSNLSIKIFNAFIFPLSRFMDKVFNKSFGKNISLVLTKE